MKPNFYYKGQQHGIDIKKDVQNVGFKDDLVNGYGRNFTFSKHLQKKVLAENLKQRAHKEAKVISDAQAVRCLKAIEIKIVAKAGGENYSVQSRILISLPF
jgi:large subunit ribosomal protein L9